MAKRLVDTAIWDKKWFRELSPTMKTVWKFITDRCDHAGVWDIDEKNLIHYVGETITVEDILNVEAFKTRFFIIEDKIFVPGFVVFQYKGILSESNRAHKSVIDRLIKLGIELNFITIKPLLSPLPSPLLGCKDKEQDKVKVKDQDKVRAGHEEMSPESKALLKEFLKPKLVP